MNDIFSNMVNVCVVIYLNDILIYLNNIEDHHTRVWEVLCHLWKNSLYARAPKCILHANTVKYLGYILSPTGLMMDPAKVQVIQNWPEPRKVKDIQSFLGFANFYRQFIYKYFNIIILLTRLTWKDLKWNFSDACHDTFNNLKVVFTSALVLTHWIPDVPMIVKTDASNYAIAAIFSIILPNGEFHPVAFHYHTLTTSELNYDTHDKDLLPIFKAFQ